MKRSIAQHIILIVAVVIFAIRILTPYIIEKPEDMHGISRSRYSIITSGLKPEGRQALHAVTFVVFASALVLYFYVRKLAITFTCENDILRIRRYGRIYQSLIATVGVINMGEIIFAITGLLTVQHVVWAHIFHSRLFGYLGSLLVCLWFFVITYNYIKAFRITPLAVILSAKNEA